MAKRGQSRLSRLARLGGLTGRISSSYLGRRVRDVFETDDEKKLALDRLHIDNAEKIVETLGRLKGAVMKVGQSVALVADTLDLPPEAAEKLRKLHAEAEAVPFASIKQSVETELEGPLSEKFASFEERPVGTASLGQAHAAVLPDGTDVVVKVLHHGVDRSVETDLMALKAILIGSRMIRRDRAEMNSIFAEIQERLEEELDYLQEAANLVLFQQIYGDDDRVRIPRSHPGWSTERVLTMDRLPGVPLDAFLETATPEARQRAGVTLANLYYEMAFTHRTLHADPHPGNYLFEPDGRVGLLDFGCVKRFDEFWIANYARAALSALEGRKEDFLDGVRRIDGWHGTNPKAADLLWRFANTLSDPYRQGPYTIGDHRDSITDRMRPIVQEIMYYPEITLPRDVVYLHRSLGGLYSIARRLVVRDDWGALLRKHAQHAIDRAEGKLPT